jgi:[ribosomal protein S5]-alanine N-acetyltransferase
MFLMKNIENSIELIGEKIFLRPIKITDANEEYVSWLNDSETLIGLATETGTNLSSLINYVQNAIGNSNCIMLAICDLVSKKHIGNIKLDNFDWIANTCELGILVGNKKFWGKGIGFEACKMTLLFAFNELEIRKILLAVYENNTSAIKLYEKLGFIKEGQLRKHIMKNNIYYDKYYMGIFKDEMK